MKQLNNKVTHSNGTLSYLFTTCALSLAFAMPTSGHGFVEFPKARQSICQAQGGYWWPDDGSGIPNLACKETFLVSNYVPFVQEHEISINVADYHNQTAVEAAVPDGTLCAAGSAEKDGLNIASPHWQKTTIKPDSNNEITLRFNAQTPHNPSFWKIYLSKPTFNADTDKLSWQDLDLVQSHGNIEVTREPDGGRFYYMQVAIPPDRSGQALLYTRWQRNDVAGEGFYNCSDIVIERDVTNPDDWFPVAYYLRQGQEANAGDQVWVRVFDKDGSEFISELYDVTADNQANWPQLLANELINKHASSINIGVKDDADSINFDTGNLLANQVWVTNADFTYQLSISAKPDNRAPVVQPIDDVVLNGGEQKAIHVHAFDDDNDPLTYQWQIPAPLTFTGEGSDIQITAPQVTEDTSFSLTVTVSDGKLSTSQSFNVTVKAVTNPDAPAWDPATAYSTGERVTYQEKVYVAKWWNRNQVPATSDAWKLATPDDSIVWQMDKTYVQGDIVEHNGKRYRAKWWTQGEEPGIANVWELQQAAK